MEFSFLWPFLTSLLISIFAIPVIIRVADSKHLMDEPDQIRKIHTNRTPTLGGVAIFAGTLFAYCCFTDFLKLRDLQFLVPALILLFFAGIKDDILLLSPLKKLAVQIVCAGLITILGNLRLTNLWGIFGVGQISALTGIFITIFLIVSLINAFNLIDGANGLAGGLGVVATAFFGTWFLNTEAVALSILSFSLCGALLGFLYYNFRNAKIFMGDTGSMILGFIISILAIRFVESNRSGIENSPWFIRAAPGVAIAVVMIPLFDMTRVFFYRLLKKRSPFSPDRSHIHHILVDIGMSHIQTTVTLLLTSIGLIILSLSLREMRSFDLVLSLLTLCTFLTAGITFLRNKKISQRKKMSSKTNIPRIQAH